MREDKIPSVEPGVFLPANQARPLVYTVVPAKTSNKQRPLLWPALMTHIPPAVFYQWDRQCLSKPQRRICTKLGYCVFGEVKEGKDVVDAIKAVPTGRVSGYDDVPKEPVVIESAVVIED